ncbi:hypothetical protein RFI_07095 [Reticulomyxa filosa]|uniref:inositol-phosphate phosphatase n=1 Tax=Reticulomyxa filosa TaxID=46433 RepID=X6NUP5_RETFI|nr:hypothetical protein RFI_07095 [Reticulomyxa filosa]|eukprot:ETO30025.1 hypothetical protein RFI_07095 [Reticulomyxa filosa]
MHLKITIGFLHKTPKEIQIFENQNFLYIIYNPRIDYHKKKEMSKLTKVSNGPGVSLPKDIDEWLALAKESAISAGKLIKQYIDDRNFKKASVNYKSNTADLVTAVDVKCEALITEKIKSRFPTHQIIGEESQEDPTKYNITDEPTWFIDPIDGTTNFMHGLPHVCVSIGLKIRKVSVLGVVHLPVLNDTYTAILGKGSYLNDKVRLRVSDVTTLTSALLLTEYGYDRTTKGVQGQLDKVQKLLLSKVQGIRSLGSCAINMCQVAAGRADLYYEGRNEQYGPKPWDVVASEVIAQEAGALVLLPEGDTFDCTKGRVLCVNGTKLRDEFLNLQLKPFFIQIFVNWFSKLLEKKIKILTPFAVVKVFWKSYSFEGICVIQASHFDIYQDLKLILSLSDKSNSKIQVEISLEKRRNYWRDETEQTSLVKSAKLKVETVRKT